jgi:hypothetical protein
MVGGDCMKAIRYIMGTSDVTDEMRMSFINNYEGVLPGFIDSVTLFYIAGSLGARLKIPISFTQRVFNFDLGLHSFSRFTDKGAQFISLRIIDSEICLDFDLKIDN